MALVKIISGAKNSGKTTLAARLAEEYRGRGEKVAGFLSDSDTPAKDNYFIKDLETGIKLHAVAVCPPVNESGWKRYGFSRFYFSENAFSAAGRIIQRLTEEDGGNVPDAVFIDELGPLELSGNGCIDSVRRLLSCYRGHLYLVIREELISDFISILELQEPEILRADYDQ